MSSASVKVTYFDMKSVLGGAGGPVFGEVQRRANLVLNRAREKCPVDNGKLRQSLTVEMRLEDGIPVGLVGSNLPYFLYVHEGTGIYAGKGPIRSHSGGMLRWPNKNKSGKGMVQYKGGKTASFTYRREVAGVPGRPFLRQALEEVGGL